MKMKFEKFYPLVVVLFAFLLYANTIPNLYNLDDELVTINHRTTSKGFNGFNQIFSEYYYQDNMGYQYDYRPITHLSFAIEHHFFGENPHTSHAINVILYALLCLLIFYLSNKLYPDKSPLFGLVVAVVFAVLPIHTEVVASIKNRDEILSLLFGLASFYILFFNFKYRVVAFVLAIIFLQLSIFSKPSTIFFIFLIPFYFIGIEKLKQFFYFLFYVLINASIFSYFFIESFNKQVSFVFILIILFVIICLLFNFKLSSIKKISMDFILKILLFCSYLLIAFSLFFGGGLFLIFAIYLSLIAIVISYYLNINLRYISLLSFPAFAAASYFFNIPYFIFVYSLFYSVLNDKISKKEISLSLLFFIGLSIPIAYKFSFVNLLSLTPIFMLYFKHKFKYIITVLAILNIIVHSEYIVISLANFSLLTFIFFNYFKIDRFKIITAFKYKLILPVIFISIGFFSLYSNVKRYENLPSGETYTEVKTIVNTVDQNIYVDMERPLLYLENPLVENWTIQQRLVAAIISSSFYIKKMVLPYPLLFYYGYDQIEILDIQNFNFYSSLFILLFSIIICIYLLFKRKFLLFFSILFILLNLVPYTNLFIPIAGIVAERLAFTASFGYSLLIALIGFLLIKKVNKKYAFIPGFIIMIYFIGYSYNRNTQWATKNILFSHDIKWLNNSSNAHSLLGKAIMEKQTMNNAGLDITKVRLAKTYFQKSIEIYPDFFNSYYDLARVNEALNDKQAAIVNYEFVVKTDSLFYDVYLDLADLYLQTNQSIKAQKNLKRYLNFSGYNLDLYFELSNLEYQLANYENVIVLNKEIIQNNPQIPEAYLNIAYAYGMLNDIESLKQYLKLGEQLAPQHQDIKIIKEKFF